MNISVNKSESGFTLIEIAVVLLILVALAGLAMPYIRGTSSAALCKATDVSMQNVKKAIMERYYLDTLGHFPQDLDATLSGISTPDYNLHYLFSSSTPASVTPTRTHKLFDPATQTGWRQGGYLQGGTVLGSVNLSVGNLDSSFKDATTINPHVNSDLINGDIVVLDGWGRPIVIQVDNVNLINNSPIVKLVSAGTNAIIETPITTATPSNGYRYSFSDDRILYLNAPTPAADINPSCDE